MEIWSQLSRTEQSALLARPTTRLSSTADDVQRIIDAVVDSGDSALKSFNRDFDNNFSDELIVNQAEIDNSENNISSELKAALEQALQILQFHTAQIPEPKRVETQPGVVCELRYQAIQAVGIYIPGGSAPLPRQC